jgi:hypothetical protein
MPTPSFGLLSVLATIGWFASLAEARAVVEARRRDDNESLPLMALVPKCPVNPSGSLCLEL